MKVLVIGAGVAGLAAAHSLSAAGVSVCILEGRNRIGGRIYTFRDPAMEAPVELGAEFIHGKPSEIFTIIRAAGLAATELSGSHRFMQDGKLSRGRDVWLEVDAIFARMADANLPDQTFSEFLTLVNSSNEAQAWAKRYVEGFNAARADLISIRSLVEDEQASQAIEGERAFRLREGYDQIAEWLWRQCASRAAALHFETTVTAVCWRKGKVEVMARSSAHSGANSGMLSFSADRAIITASLGVLKAPDDTLGAIRFEPELPGVRGALEHLKMGHAIRITLSFSSSFSKKYPQIFQAGFTHSDDAWLPTWWTSVSADRPILTGWAGGPKAEKFKGFTDQEVKERAIDSLSKIIGSNREEVANHIERWYTHHWSNDPFALGAYSYARVGGIEARRVLAAPIENTLYIAGEATDTAGHSATVHGAIATGQRAARSILGA